MKLMKLMKSILIIWVLGLAVPGCSSDEPQPDVQLSDLGEFVDAPATRCGCSPSGAKRCAGNRVESCTDGKWTVEPSCEEPRVCVADDCLGNICQLARCVEKTSDCPDSAKYSPSDAVTVERLRAVAVGDCVDGGSQGSEAPFNDRGGQSHQRSLVISSLGCRTPDLDFSRIFGVDVGGVVSPADLKTTAQVPPNTSGQWYNQAIKLHRVATLWKGEKFAGTATLIDWIFQPQLATGPACPVPSDLPPAGTIPVQRCRTWLDDCHPCEAP
jgi:hypothetical protein